MRVTWLAEVLHSAGLPLVPLDGWQGRGVALTTVNGVVAHHTATPASSSDGTVAKILRDGRSDLPGPLAQLGLDRQGRFWLIADGKCNHNGHGMWGNQAVGIEAFNNGRGEPWPVAQMDAWVRGCAAILKHLGQNEGHVQAHRETDPLRKVDPVGVDMNNFRRKVAALLRPTPEDDVPPGTKTVTVTTDPATGHGRKNAPGVKKGKVLSCSVLAQPEGWVAKAGIAPEGGPDTEAVVAVDVGGPTFAPIDVVCFVAFNP